MEKVNNLFCSAEEPVPFRQDILLDDFEFATARSKRRSFRKKFRRFVEKANSLYEDLVDEADHPLDDDSFEEEM